MPETASQRRARKISPRERKLLDILGLIVRETMEHPPLPPVASDSYLPKTYVRAAQEALALYGEAVKPMQVAA